MTENPRLQFWTKKKPLNKIQENSGKPFNELRNKNQQTQQPTKEIKTTKKNQTETMELKNSINEKKNEPVNIDNRTDQIEEIISDIEDRNLEMTQVEEEKEN